MSSILTPFNNLRAQLNLLECPAGFTGTTVWRDHLQPLLEHARCDVEAVTLSVTDVGPRRTVIAVVRRRGDDNLAAKLNRWNRRLLQRSAPTSTVGTYLGRKECSFLERGPGRKAIFASDGSSVTINHTHIMGQKPPATAYTPHHADAGSVEEADTLSRKDFVKLTTAQESFLVPPTVRKRLLRAPWKSSPCHPCCAKSSTSWTSME